MCGCFGIRRVHEDNQTDSLTLYGCGLLVYPYVCKGVWRCLLFVWTTVESTFLIYIMKKQWLLYLLCAVMIHAESYGQTYKNEKRIYLVDVTASMEGRGNVETPAIFKYVKQALCATLRDIERPETEIVLIPFTNVVHKPITGQISDCDSLVNEIGRMTIQRGDTNIAGAWKRGLQELDSLKVNYMFLLTDGLHNCGPEKEKLYQQLRDWEELSAGKYMFAFYVMLTPNAKELEIANIVDETKQMWLIESMDVNVSFISTDMQQSANVNQDNRLSIHFVSNNRKVFEQQMDFTLRLEDNPYYRLEHVRVDFAEHCIRFELDEKLPRMEMPTQCDLKLHVEYDNEKYPLCFFTPDVIDFRVINRGVRKMTIKKRLL